MGNTTSCCKLSDNSTLHVCVFVLLSNIHPAPPPQDHNPTAQGAVAFQSAYTLRGVRKWVFNQGHLAHLLFSPQPAFHPAPGEQGDRWGTIHSLRGFTHKWPHSHTHLKVECDAWLQRCDGTDRILTGVTPSVLSPPLWLCTSHYLYVCALLHTCLCVYLCLLVSICAFINPACALHPAGYMLWWEVPNVESSREERSLPNSTLQYQLTGLTSTTVYTIQVAALTAAGRGVVTSSTISTGVPPGTINKRTDACDSGC